jgi:hypothetical protein
MVEIAVAVHTMTRETTCPVHLAVRTRRAACPDSFQRFESLRTGAPRRAFREDAVTLRVAGSPTLHAIPGPLTSDLALPRNTNPALRTIGSVGSTLRELQTFSIRRAELTDFTLVIRIADNTLLPEPAITPHMPTAIVVVLQARNTGNRGKRHQH